MEGLVTPTRHHDIFQLCKAEFTGHRTMVLGTEETSRLTTTKKNYWITQGITLCKRYDLCHDPGYLSKKVDGTLIPERFKGLDF